jgi:hypothetical protein
VADWLAGKSAGENIDACEVVGAALSDVSKLRDIGPVFGEDSAAPLIDLHLPCDLHSGSL